MPLHRPQSLGTRFASTGQDKSSACSQSFI